VIRIVYAWTSGAHFIGGLYFVSEGDALWALIAGGTSVGFLAAALWKRGG